MFQSQPLKPVKEQIQSFVRKTWPQHKHQIKDMLEGPYENISNNSTTA